MNGLGTYSFLPWLRQGMANAITAQDMDQGVKTRASINIALRLTGEAVGGGPALTQDIPRQVALYGPGDIVGIDESAIVKVEPRNWQTNFEANYLPYIDFFDEDYTWRYTPAAPGGPHDGRLRPWLALVVLAEGEFVDAGNLGGPLPVIELQTDPGTVFPPSADLWAWAHVHVDRSVIAGDTMTIGAGATAPVLDQLQQTLDKNADLAHSRIISPRRLVEQTGYHAFLVPSFETGRLAGLGLDPENAPFATHGAWDDYPAGSRPQPQRYPIYHRWFFRTGDAGDFEYLVRLLKPRPMDSRVGRRDIDMQDPGSNIPGIDDPELGGVLKLGGALQVPFDTLGEADKVEVTKYETWAEPAPHPFQRKLAAFVNLADSYEVNPPVVANVDPELPQPIIDAADPDPLVTAPIYGRWHAKTPRLLRERDGSPVPQSDNWVHDLNLDPRFRVAAGFGTEVIQDNQEAYMDAAWDQIGEVLKANQRIRWAVLAHQVGHVWQATHLDPLRSSNPDRYFALTTPVDRRVLVGGVTRLHTVRQSIVPRAAVSAPMRRILRPGARLARKLGFTPEQPAEALARRINDREIVPAPPKVTPGVLTTPDELAEAIEPSAPDIVKDTLRVAPWLPWLFLVVAILFILLGLLGAVLGALAIVVAVVAAVLFWYLRRIKSGLDTADTLREENQTPGAVDDIPVSPDFRITPANDDFRPTTGGNSDSPEARRFKAALREAYRLIETSRVVGAILPKPSLDFTGLISGTFAALDPAITVPKRTFGGIHIPPRIRDALFEIFDEPMAYPEFNIPMYKPLVDKSAELFLPNIKYMEQNTISLLETNQRFIEAYMVGLNHEFGRELLWREYYSDNRGSYFRQFWDVSTFLPRSGEDLDALREKLRDIPPIHRWSRFSDLGDHDHRERPGDNEEELVLVIRGELLKKYPNAVIYAQRAAWQTDEDGEIDKSKPRNLAPIDDADIENADRAKIRTPLYEAKAPPDIAFLGFDLTALEARGETEENPEDPGWFFVIKERPGEPRFGFDIDQDGAPGGVKHLWNDISWLDAMPGGGPGDVLRPLPTPGITLTAFPGSPPPDQQTQHDEDVQIQWNDQVTSAELAYVLYQVPVLVAVHSAEMLPK